MGSYGDQEKRNRQTGSIRRDYLLAALALLVLAAFAGGIIYSALRPAPAPPAASAPLPDSAPAPAGSGSAAASGNAVAQAAAAGTGAEPGAVSEPPAEPAPAKLPAMVTLPCKVYLGSPAAKPLKPACAAQKQILAKYGLVVTNDPDYLSPREWYGLFYRPTDDKSFIPQAEQLERELKPYTRHFFEAIGVRYIFIAGGYEDRNDGSQMGGLADGDAIFACLAPDVHHEIHHAARGYLPEEHNAHIAAIEAHMRDINAWQQLTGRDPSFASGRRAVQVGAADLTPSQQYLAEGYINEYAANGGLAEDLAEFGMLVMSEHVGEAWYGITGLTSSGDEAADHRRVLARLEEMSRAGQIHKAIGEKIRMTREFYKKLL